MVLDDLCVLEELLFLFGVAGLVLQEGGRELAEDVGVLTHQDACFDVFFLIAGWPQIFLHFNKRII